MADENAPVIQADNVTVVETNAAVDAAERRADDAEQLAADITDAAMRTAQGAEIQDIKEGIAECQTETEQLENEAVADRARLSRLETTQAEMTERLSSMASTQAETLELLRTLTAPLTPPPSDPSPTPEVDPADIRPDAAAPAAPPVPARAKRFRWM